MKIVLCALLLWTALKGINQSTYQLVLDSHGMFYRQDHDDPEWYEVSPKGMAFVHPYLIAISASQDIVLWPDSCDQDSLRQLRVRLIHQLNKHQLNDNDTAFFLT